VQVGDLVKWTIPNEDGMIIDHLGVVLEHKSNIRRKSHGKPRASVKVYFVDFHRASWYFIDELEMVSEAG